MTKEPLPLSPLTCTVVVPCRNEAGNVAELVDRVPVMGPHTEIIFVDGASTDGTQERVEECIRANPNRDIKLLHQRGGGGKAAAVFQGFDAAAGDVVMILDADMTVAPEDLPRFWHAIAEDRADFVNGSRLIYPMDAEAMPPLNLLGNRAFSGLLSVLTGTRLSDTLCGTKAMHRSDWQRIRAVRRRFGGHDVWGDFDLLLGAGLVGMRIVDMPIVYGARQSGESKMRPLAHGLALGRTCATGALAITRQRVFGRWSA